MNIERTRLKQLLTDYISATISKPDLEELLDFVAMHLGDNDIDAFMQELLEETETNQVLPVDSEGIYQRIISHSTFREQIVPVEQHRSKVWLKIAAILLLGGVLFLYNYIPKFTASHESASLIISTTPTNKQDKRALLRLADGSVIDLDSASSGLLAAQGGVQITLKGTELHYEGKGEADEGDGTALNAIITPRGRQYQVVLPDGSKIWLNAATELKYPVRFDREARIVEVAGEAYFEVEKAKDWPFIVKTNTQEIEVLGTHFNVSAYEDDQATKTTLVEGRVQVNRSSTEKAKEARPSITLKPGEQAITLKKDDRIQVEHIDPEEVISWKKNLFVFNNEEIEAVMKKVGRWYDVEVEYKNGMEGKRIGGTIPRLENIEKLMEALKATGLLNYKMEGGKVIIME